MTKKLTNALMRRRKVFPKRKCPRQVGNSFAERRVDNEIINFADESEKFQLLFLLCIIDDFRQISSESLHVAASRVLIKLVLERSCDIFQLWEQKPSSFWGWRSESFPTKHMRKFDSIKPPHTHCVVCCTLCACISALKYLTTNKICTHKLLNP